MLKINFFNLSNSTNLFDNLFKKKKFAFWLDLDSAQNKKPISFFE